MKGTIIITYDNFQPVTFYELKEKLGEVVNHYEGFTLSWMKVPRSNPRFHEIRESLARLDSHVSDKRVWSETDYIRKHLELLETEYQSFDKTARKEQ